MDETQALDALAQETRLRSLHLPVTAGPDGLAAGAVGDALSSLIVVLLRDRCQGQPEIHTPAIAALSARACPSPEPAA